VQKLVGLFLLLPILANAQGARGTTAARGTAPVRPDPSAVPATAALRRANLLDPTRAFWKTKAPDSVRVVVETSRGNFIIALDRGLAPAGVDRFFNLARAGYYDDSRFFRVVPYFVAQFGIAGDPVIARTWAAQNLPVDSVRGTNARGTITFAQRDTKTRNANLFINLRDNTRLDADGFAPIGRVVEGMDVVDSLYSEYGERPMMAAPLGHGALLYQESNKLLDREYPRLDKIIRMRIDTAPPKPDTTRGVVSGQQKAKRIALVTGSTDGLGREVARKLAAGGAHVIVHGRNVERGTALVKEIEQEGKGSARFFAADLGSLAQVRALADSVLKNYDRLDLLVNNAGIWLEGNTRSVSADGHEMHFAVNYLSGFLLTRLLLPRLLSSAPSRVVNVASTAQNPIQFDDVMLTRGYNDGRGYGQSKLAQIMFTVDLARELAGKNVTVVALHPATMMNTTMVLSRNAQPRATVEEGTAAVMNLIDAPGIESGAYYTGLRPGRPNAQALDDAAREQLRTLSMQLVGIK
jgi:NAD(P)-dependent dehydrogenase (short-subunit alcohol dehydrogenase family)/cyclophilin family peptidyl-prolyl cis-trans isomerase